MRCFRNSEDIEIHLTDNGKGFSDSFDFKNPESFGLMIMNNIVINQLKGSAECINDSGVSWRIIFSDNKYYERV